MMFEGGSQICRLRRNRRREHFTMSSPSVLAAPANVADLEQLTELNREYIRSVQESDVAWFDRNLAEDFMCSNPDGSRVDRAGFLKTDGSTGENLASGSR
jgi:hypothetical protein